MTSCRKCGHGSHCGTILKITDPPHTEGESIQVCTNCRCERCESENPISKS